MQLSARTILSLALSAGLLTSAACGDNSPTSPTSPADTSETGAVVAGIATGTGGGVNTSRAGSQPAAALPPGLTVTVVGTNRSATVGTDGRFEIDDVPAGDRQLQFANGTTNATVPLGSVANDQFIEIVVEVGSTSAQIVEEVRTAKVTLCHLNEEGGYQRIDVSVNAESAHRAHGDGEIGEPVPGEPTKIFDANCQPVGPSISLQKSTNDEDADSAPGPDIALGSTVTWTYVVTNDGSEPLTSVAVVDDQGVVVDCGSQTTLAVGASMTCTGTGLATAEGQYANLGTATAAWSSTAGSGTVTDSDASHYFGISPITIEKSTNGSDADFAPGQTIAIGDPVIWEYAVTNIGTVDLTGVLVVDDQGVAVDCGGQTTLAPGATMTCTGAGVAIAGQYANVGTATATWNATTPTGPVTGPAEASDPSHYFGGDEEEGEKVTLCHRTGAGFYVMINVSINAEPAHLAHGDGKPGEAVPGLPGRSFGASCGVQ